MNLSINTKCTSKQDLSLLLYVLIISQIDITYDVTVSFN